MKGIIGLKILWKKLQFPHEIRGYERDIQTINTYSVLLWNRKRKKPLGRHWRIWDINIKMGFQEI